VEAHNHKGYIATLSFHVNKTLLRKTVMQLAAQIAPRSQTANASKKMLWIGGIISALCVLFLVFDAVIKLMKLPPVVEGTIRLGYPLSSIVGLGIVLLVSTLLYAFPRTSVLGAILLTGYLGGATATHVRVGGDLFSILFPGILGLLIWGGLYLRDERLRALVPFRRDDQQREELK
jgi:hypothetical protein